MNDFDSHLKNFRSIMNKSAPGQLEKVLQKEVEPIFSTPPLMTLSQRLQLGLLHQARPEWANATHSRFEHSIGTVANCIVACDIINENTRRLNKDTPLLNEQDAFELAIAAAIHDCGHLPISHATERGVLSHCEDKRGVLHEERIIDFLLVENDYFDPIRQLILQNEYLGPESLYRIAYIVHPHYAEERLKSSNTYRHPKRAIMQILNSELDMDRLDFVIRDAKKTNYKPVLLMVNSFQDFLKGIFLVPAGMTFEKRHSDDDVELCIDGESSTLEKIFIFLVARVMLYKFVYFCNEVRSYEGAVAHLVGGLFNSGASIKLLDMMMISDDNFIKDYLPLVIDTVQNKHDAEVFNLIKDQLKKKRVNRFEYSGESIKAADIRNPRVREEFIHYLGKRSYINELENYIYDMLKKKCNVTTVERGNILLDPFQLKAGGGDFLVRNRTRTNNDYLYSTLEDHMNGSNIHRLCVENRLDLHYYRELSDSDKQAIRSSFGEIKMIGEALK